MLKSLDTDNRKWLLNTINEWWSDKQIEEELYHARVATIYKNGEWNKASNYRPITLLSSFYEIYMIMIRTIIQAEMEKDVSKTQYGFRPAKNAAHAIYIGRDLASRGSVGAPVEGSQAIARRVMLAMPPMQTLCPIVRGAPPRKSGAPSGARHNG